MTKAPQSSNLFSLKTMNEFGTAASQIHSLVNLTNWREGTRRRQYEVLPKRKREVKLWLFALNKGNDYEVT